MSTAEDAQGIDKRAEQIRTVIDQLDHTYRDGERHKPKRTFTNLDNLFKLDPWIRDRLRFNGLSEVIEWEGARLRDSHITDIRIAIGRTYGLEYSAQAVYAMCEQTSRQRTYHPIARFLSGLLWDGQPRIDGFLSTHIGAVDSEVTRAISRRWFVSCVARAMGCGEKPVPVHSVLILAGPQGAGKSTALRLLASDQWFSDSALDLRNPKDCYQQIRGNIWIYELAELASTRARDAETVKAFLSAATDRYRPAYGKTVVESHRQVIFTGSTNSETFLSDPSGARRFWPVTVGTIDLEAIKRDRLMLWAEAVSAFQAGEVWWLSRDEDQALADMQERYQNVDPWEGSIAAWLPSQPAGVSVADILESAIDMDTDKMHKGHELRVAGILGRLGYTKKRVTRGSSRVWRWFAA